MAKLLHFEYFVNVIVSVKCDDLTFVTLENVTNVKSSYFFSQTLPQTQTQTQLHRIHSCSHIDIASEIKLTKLP